MAGLQCPEKCIKYASSAYPSSAKCYQNRIIKGMQSETVAKTQGCLAPAREQHPKGCMALQQLKKHPRNQFSTAAGKTWPARSSPGCRAVFSGRLAALAGQACALEDERLWPDRDWVAGFGAGVAFAFTWQVGCAAALRGQRQGAVKLRGSRGWQRPALTVWRVCAYSARYRRSHSSSRVLSGRVALPRRYQ